MHPVVSILDEQAVDPFIAQAALDRFRDRIRESFAGGAAALVGAGALLFTTHPTMAIAPFAGAVVAGFVAAGARADHQALIARLVRQRSAYEIEAVRDAATHLVTPLVRERVARSLARLVLEADGVRPRATTTPALYDRVRTCRAELVSIAFDLVQPDARVHPSAVALLTRLLTSEHLSPLYNAALPAEHVRLALMRAQASITRTPAE